MAPDVPPGRTELTVWWIVIAMAIFVIGGPATAMAIAGITWTCGNVCW